jgi:hypothetical protein
MMFTPDDFRTDPYGHWTNQTSHALQVGMLIMLWGGAVAYFLGYGEFPDKIYFGISALVVYLAYELLLQGWQGWDTLNDTSFVVGWGVCAPMAVFSEVARGSSMITADVLDMAPYIAGLFAHLSFGTLIRWMRAKKIGGSL